ncbi:Eisosome component PIL1-domain-containing protein [Aspergillus lucknowensis]|uniref:Eisosome component PIL1-domain-containing protein n=1 Tax=Aspergillus lucknowensis TaxID=176173 RepID=A0ABR4M2H9_9EURO
MNRTLSGRRRSSLNAGRRRFSFSTFRGLQQPQLSKKMNRMIKTENAAIAAHESAARQRMSIAAQLSDWGETSEDDAIFDISDKLGVLMAEMGEQEDIYASSLEEYRSLLKHIRETESSVQPTRDQRTKIADDIQRLKLKEPNSHKIETMEQELVRAEAQNLVAEAQLTNVTRQRFKEAFHVHLAAAIDRGEKQIILARHARRLLNCLDDTPVTPGDEPKAYAHANEAKQIIEDAERDLRSWESSVEPVEIGAGASISLPSSAHEIRGEPHAESPAAERVEDREEPREVEEPEEPEEVEEPEAEDTSTAAEVPPIAARDTTARPARIHSISAPMMDPEALEEHAPYVRAPAAERVEGIGREKAGAAGVSGVNEGQEIPVQKTPVQHTLGPETTGPSPSQDPGQAAGAEFPIRTKVTGPQPLGGALDSQVQRLAIPI